MGILRPAGDYDRSYKQDMALVRHPWQWVVLAITLIVAFTAPLWGNAYVVTTANRLEGKLLFYKMISTYDTRQAVTGRCPKPFLSRNAEHVTQSNSIILAFHLGWRL